MTHYELKCPYCGADLEAEDGLDTFFCKHCGGKIILEGQTDKIIDAKVRAKELELDKYKFDRQYEEVEKEYQREKEREEKNDKTSKKIFIWLGIIMVIMLLFYSFVFPMIFD